MKAARLHAFGESLRIDSVEVPKVARDEVLLRIKGAGVCHTDLHIREGKFPPIWPFPFALGHENAGIVEAIGPDVTRFRPGDGVVVWGAHGCGNCRVCHEGDEPPCGMEQWLGNGGYAEFMHIPSQRLLVPLNGVDPIAAAPLADAGVTPYRAIKKALPHLYPGASVAIVGVGGLGHLALQILRAIAPWARIFAVDVDAAKLESALNYGADNAIDARGDAASEIKRLSGGEGARAVIDLVGSDASLRIAAAAASRKSILVLVGLAGGMLPFSFFALPAESIVTTSYWGSYTDLEEVLELARTGVVKAQIETFPLDQVDEVLNLLEQGKIKGRAVITP
jgi:alcohol dehydrogenase, propanol-preferring